MKAFEAVWGSHLMCKTFVPMCLTLPALLENAPALAGQTGVPVDLRMQTKKPQAGQGQAFQAFRKSNWSLSPNSVTSTTVSASPAITSQQTSEASDCDGTPQLHFERCLHVERAKFVCDRTPLCNGGPHVPGLVQQNL